MTPGSDLTISRDTLRAELAEMELRLRLFFNEQLQHKADLIVVQKLQEDFFLLQRTALLQEGPIARTTTANSEQIRKITDGELTKAQQLSYEQLVHEVLDERSDAGWSQRQRNYATVGLSVAILSFILSIFYTLHVIFGIG